MQKKASPAALGHDSFDGPAGSEASSLKTDAVLTVDRNTTLTLGTDALIVLEDGLRHRGNCCGLLPSLSQATRAIPFHNILWAGLGDFEVNVRYAQPVGRKGKSCIVAHINYPLTDESLHSHAKQWVEQLLGRAYPPRTRMKKRIKVLVNPFGGQGYAQKIWAKDVEPIFAAADCEVDVERTTYRGHAVEIAEKLDIDAFDIIACASGDGLPHEVFNGLARRPDARRALGKIAVCQIPCGSGNAMSLNCNGTDSPSLAAVEIVKGIRTPLDLVAVTQGDRKLWSFLSQAVGIIAETDLGTESLRWMGSFRFIWGILVRMLGKTIYPAEVSVVTETDDKREIRELYRRAAEEHKAARAKNLGADEPDHELFQSSNAELPKLKYGTILDDLHEDFITTDHPKLGNFYAGNMCYMSSDAPFFAAALPSDGRLDLINIPGDITRTACIKMLVTVENGTLINFPQVAYSKIRAFRIIPRRAPAEAGRKLSARIGQWLGGAAGQTDGLVAIDGESIPFEPFQAEVVPKLGTVLSRNGIYEFSGPKVPQ